MRFTTPGLFLAAGVTVGVAVGVLTAAVPPAQAQAQGNEPLPTWIWFADKGLTDGDVPAALARRTEEISERALERRRRVREDGGLDSRDLDPSPAYIAAVLATGAHHRATSRWLNGISVVADDTQLGIIARLPFVAGIQPVARRARERSATGSGPPLIPPPTEYGVAEEQMGMIGVPSLLECGLTGEGVVVAVQDTGFVLTHQALAHVDVVAQHDFVNDDDVVENEEGDPEGAHNHGSSVLSLIAGWDEYSFIGAAPDVSVILSKTEDVSQEEPIEEDWFVEGLEWVEAEGADVFTASLGYFDWYEAEDMDGQTAVTSIAAGIAVGNGLIMVNSAGNAGPDPSTLGAPADADGLISVGAVDLFSHIADFSSRGPTADGRIKPDVSAPGVETWVIDPATTDEYRQGNGTSYAAPHVAGLTALLVQALGPLTPEEAWALLTSTASQADAPDNDMGWGIVDGVAAVGLYCTCQDHDEDGFYDASCGGQDCDDFRETVHPGAEEVCDGLDDDCDGEILADEGDEDGDGYLTCDPDPSAADCDDGDADSHPGASEEPYDGVDQDCDGEDVVDVDGDGVPGPDEDCDDEDPGVLPGAPEICDDAIDNDCDGWADADDAECYEGAPATLLQGTSCECRAGGKSAVPVATGLVLAVLVRSRRRA